MRPGERGGVYIAVAIMLIIAALLGFAMICLALYLVGGPP